MNKAVPIVCAALLTTATAPAAADFIHISTIYEFVPNTTVTWLDGNTDIITGTLTGDITYDTGRGTYLGSNYYGHITLTGPGPEAGEYGADGSPGPLGMDGPNQTHALKFAPIVDGNWLLLNFDTPLAGEAADLSYIDFLRVFSFVNRSLSVQGEVAPVSDPAAPASLPEPSTALLLGPVLFALRRIRRVAASD